MRADFPGARGPWLPRRRADGGRMPANHADSRRGKIKQEQTEETESFLRYLCVLLFK
jgi:hypothetical protein